MRGWRIRAPFVFLAYLMISGYLPYLWADWTAPFRLFDLTGLPVWAGAAIGVLVYEAGAWLYHRSLHGSNFLWALSPSVVSTAPSASTRTAPSGSALSTSQVGPRSPALRSQSLSAVAAGNVRGSGRHHVPWRVSAHERADAALARLCHSAARESFVASRPNVHAKNYSDLPLFDLLLGTFHNPKASRRSRAFTRAVPDACSRCCEE